MMGIEKATRYDTNRDGKERQTCMTLDERA